MRKGKRALTKRTIDALKEPGWYTDRDLPGFSVRVLPSGSKVFAARYVPRGSRVRRMVSLGVYGVVTLEEARGKARVILSAAALGDDPARKSPTWAEWSVTHFERLTAKSKETFHRRFLGFTEEKNKRATKAEVTTDPTFREIRERWGPRPIGTFTPNDIEAERQALRAAGKTKTTINRWLAVVGGCFQSAVRLEMIDRNPVAKVKADRESPPRSRTLTTEEMGRLLAALEEERKRDPWAAAAVLLAILTGARRGEILSLRWADVRLEEGFARLPDSKSGKPRFLPLPGPALEELKRLPHVGSFVVAPMKREEPKEGEEPKEETPRPDLKRAWERLMAAAALEGATFHDLRRTFGRELNRTAGLRVAQEALGHTTPDQTAAVYTPEGFEDVKAAAEKRAAILPFPVRAAG